MLCEKCDKTLEIGDWPFCPHEKASLSVIGDDIPGGVLIRHGLCNEDGSPRRYYSKSEIAKEMAKRGLVDGNIHSQDQYARQARELKEQLQERRRRK